MATWESVTLERLNRVREYANMIEDDDMAIVAMIAMDMRLPRDEREAADAANLMLTIDIEWPAYESVMRRVYDRRYDAINAEETARAEAYRASEAARIAEGS